MKNIATFILKKYFAELLAASLFLTLWSILDNSTIVEFEGSFFDALFVVFLGTLVTGYLIFVCAGGVVSLFFSQARKITFIAICFLSFLYVLTYFIFAPKNDLTIPIAL